MEIEESEFDKLVNYTLRIELLSGKVLIYRIDTGNKQYLIDRLREKSDGEEEGEPLRFLWFQIEPKRSVMVNVDFIVRVTFCFDYTDTTADNGSTYYDNFGLLQKDSLLEEQETKEGEVRLHLIEETYLPQAIIYHKGKEPDDDYDGNPLTYSELDELCLSGLNLEIEGHFPLRQFISLVDNDGEEGFIPLNQIVVMEFDDNLVFMGNEEEVEVDEEEEE